MASWIMRARGAKATSVNAMDALTNAGYHVEISPRGTYYLASNEVVLVIWRRNTRLTAEQFLHGAGVALDGTGYQIEPTLLTG
jgi:hypothetical protein